MSYLREKLGLKRRHYLLFAGVLLILMGLPIGLFISQPIGLLAGSVGLLSVAITALITPEFEEAE